MPLQRPKVPPLQVALCSKLTAAATAHRTDGEPVVFGTTPALFHVGAEDTGLGASLSSTMSSIKPDTLLLGGSPTGERRAEDAAAAVEATRGGKALAPLRLAAAARQRPATVSTVVRGGSGGADGRHPMGLDATVFVVDRCVCGCALPACGVPACGGLLLRSIA
jgi:hypothetical protein